MISFLIVMEDTVMRGNFNEWNVWEVEICDNFKGKHSKVEWTQEQLSSVLALGLCSVGEDNIPGYDIEKLSSVAEAAVSVLPVECRPIP